MAQGSFTVYLLRSDKTDQVYVGITSQPIRKRMNQHRQSAAKGQTKLANAMREYGAESFRIEPIACCRSYHDLRHCEEQLIAQYDSLNNGLNSTAGGAGSPGCQWPEQGRERMRKSARRNWDDVNYRSTISEAQKLAWARKSPEMVAQHAARALATIKRYHAAKGKSEPKKPMFGPYKGKGFNMLIKTHCPQGHPYDEKNTIKQASGRRSCRACKTIAQRLRRAKDRAAGIRRLK